MLVLMRFIGERIMIGDDIVITVVDCCSRKVKLGVDAPPRMRVDREEIRELRRERGQAHD